MALINQGGKLLLQNGALASGAGCCCEAAEAACDCCPGEDYFIEYEVIPSDDPKGYDEMRYWTLQKATGNSFTVDQWLATYGASRKEDAPSRACLEKAVVYEYKIATGYLGPEECNFRIRYRIYIPDCSTGTFVDITNDYNEPTITDPYEPEPVGFWEWQSQFRQNCDIAGFTLPPWLDRDPFCNPLP